jgi:hypothetical protein
MKKENNSEMLFLENLRKENYKFLHIMLFAIPILSIYLLLELIAEPNISNFQRFLIHCDFFLFILSLVYLMESFISALTAIEYFYTYEQKSKRENESSKDRTEKCYVFVCIGLFFLFQIIIWFH